MVSGRQVATDSGKEERFNGFGIGGTAFSSCLGGDAVLPSASQDSGFIGAALLLSTRLLKRDIAVLIRLVAIAGLTGLLRTFSTGCSCHVGMVQAW